MYGCVAGGHAEKLGKCCWNVFLSSHSGWWRLLFYFRCKIMSECACSLTQDPNLCREYIVLITSLWESRYPETGSSLEQNQNKPLVTPNNNHISDWSLQPVLRKGVAQQHPSLGKQPGHGQGHSTWTGTRKHRLAEPWAQPAATNTGTGGSGDTAMEALKYGQQVSGCSLLSFTVGHRQRGNGEVSYTERTCCFSLGFLLTVVTMLFTGCLSWPALFLLSPTPVAFAEYFPMGVLWISFML